MIGGGDSWPESIYSTMKPRCHPSDTVRSCSTTLNLSKQRQSRKDNTETLWWILSKYRDHTETIRNLQKLFRNLKTTSSLEWWYVRSCLSLCLNVFCLMTENWSWDLKVWCWFDKFNVVLQFLTVATRGKWRRMILNTQSMESQWGHYSSPFPWCLMFYTSINIVLYHQLVFINTVANSVPHFWTPLHTPTHYDQQRVFSNRHLWTQLYAPAKVCWPTAVYSLVCTSCTATTSECVCLNCFFLFVFVNRHTLTL